MANPYAAQAYEVRLPETVKLDNDADFKNKRQNKAMQDTADVPDAPPRKRTKALSCEQCRRRKLKCDRGWPCGACRDRNEQHLCKWENGVVPERGSRDANELTQVLQRMAVVESNLERLLSRIDAAESRWEKTSSIQLSNFSHLAPHKDNNFAGLSWEPSPRERMRQQLDTMTSKLPEKHKMHYLVNVFMRDFGWFQDIVDRSMVCERLNTVEEFIQRQRTVPDYIEHMNQEELTHLIYSEALLFAVFSLAPMFSCSDRVDTKPAQRSCAARHGQFFNEAMQGLAVLNVFEEPHIDYVLVMLLLISGICMLRAPVVPSVLLLPTIQVAFLLDLDEEPSPELPEAEKRRRVQLFAMLCINDWFMTSMVKRYPSIRDDPRRFPSLFGSDQSRARYLTDIQQQRLKLASLFCRSSSLMMPPCEDYSYVQRLHDETIALKAMLPVHQTHMRDALFGHDSFTSNEGLQQFSLTVSIAGLDYLLIRIHLQYYMRGWDDPRYRLSRDVCFESSRNLLRIFRAAFSWPVTMDGAPCKQMPNQVTFLSRIWWFCNWSTAAAMLLLKHLTMLNERDETPIWNLERESMVQDLCIMSRLLHYLAPIASVARDGYDALQRVASNVLQQSFQSPNNSPGNSVMHWAERIIPSCARDSVNRHEPFNMLSSLVRNHGFQERAAGEVVSTSQENELRNGTFPTPTESVSRMPDCIPPTLSMHTSATNLPSVNSNDLETFWSQFAPSLCFNESEPSISMPPPLPDPSLYLSPSVDQAAPDAALMLHQEDNIFAPSTFNYHMDTIGPFTDDFIRSVDGHNRSLSGTDSL